MAKLPLSIYLLKQDRVPDRSCIEYSSTSSVRTIFGLPTNRLRGISG